MSESVQDDYTNETFDSEPTQTRTQTSAQTRTHASGSTHAAPTSQPIKNKPAKYTKENGSVQISPNNNNLHKHSESESEDSFSMAPSGEYNGSIW